jgi:tRNA-splicing ligase RtcB
MKKKKKKKSMPDTITKIDDYRWQIQTSYKPGMLVPGIIYASEAMLPLIQEEHALEQVANVAFLPGIVCCSLAMPDIHWGYGFPIGGVAATRVSDGVVSPGGVGFDINCGTRLLRTDLTEAEVKPKIDKLMGELYASIPSGLGSSGKIIVSQKELKEVMTQGSQWALEKGFGEAEDIEATEESGCLKGADPDKVSAHARKRGIPQLGTLGSGNHFLEVQVVAKIYDREAAAAMGVHDTGQVLVLIHTGSRGFGHQVCTDYLKVLAEAVSKYGINLPDRQLACAPVQSAEGRDYLAAMACAANFAWANRHFIAHWTRGQVYDVAHNIAKIEEHNVGGRKEALCVHRKGATRAFPPGHPNVPTMYRDIGQPVIIPGDMGRYSFVAVGTETAMEQTFGSTCHGAGRMMSRGAAKRSLKGIDVTRQLAEKGITVKTGSLSGLAEEASPAYKDVADVVEVTHGAGISCNVFKSRPIGVIKG